MHPIASLHRGVATAHRPITKIGSPPCTTTIGNAIICSPCSLFGRCWNQQHSASGNIGGRASTVRASTVSGNSATNNNTAPDGNAQVILSSYC